MQLKTFALLGIAAAVGYVWLKGLHLDDIKQIVVNTADQVSSVGFDPVPPPAIQPPGNESIIIGSFNIQTFGNAKESKTHVYNEIAKIVGNFDLLAIQEIRTQDDQFMPRFARRVSELTGRPYHVIVGPRLGNSHVTEQYAYIYNAQKIVANPQYAYTVQDPENLLHREPYVTMFAARGVPDDQRFTFVLMNVHTDPDVAGAEMDVLANAFDVVSRHASQMSPSGEDDIIMLGDFNTDVPSLPSGQFGRQSRSLRPEDLFGLGRVRGIHAVIQNEPTNTRQTKLYDNILFKSHATREFKRGGVYDIGKYHNLRQDQVLEISDHLPVWAEFSAYEYDERRQRNVAGAGAGVTR